MPLCRLLRRGRIGLGRDECKEPESTFSAWLHTGLTTNVLSPAAGHCTFDHDLPCDCQQNPSRPRLRPLHLCLAIFFSHLTIYACCRLQDRPGLSTYLLMSSRVTRSSARQAASQATSSTPITASVPAVSVAAAPPIPPTTTPLPSTRKRKTNTTPAQGPESPSSARRTKRQRVAEASPPPQQPPQPSVSAQTPSSAIRHRKGKAPATMSSPGWVGSS